MTQPPDLFLGLLANFTEGDAERLGARLQAEFDGDTDAMLAAAWSMGARAYCNTVLGRNICRICGCWEYGACDPPCHWVELDLCSACDGPHDSADLANDEEEALPAEKPANAFRRALQAVWRAIRNFFTLPPPDNDDGAWMRSSAP